MPIATTTAASPLVAGRALEQMVYHAVMEFAPWPMAEVEGNAHVVQAVNPAFCALLGKSEEDLIGKPIAQLFKEGHATHGLLDRVQGSGEAATYVETAHNTPGPIYWSYTCWPLQAKEVRHVGLMIQVTETSTVDQQTKAINEALLISSVQQHELTDVADRLNVRLVKEIAEREKAQEEVRAFDERLQSALDAAELGTWSLDTATGLLNVDERYKAIFGVASLEQTLAQGVELVHPADRDRVAHAMDEAMRIGVDKLINLEYRVIHPDGSVHWVLSKGRVVFADEGSTRILTRFGGTVGDITARKEGEEKLRQNYESFFALINNAPFAFYIIDDSFRMRHMSAAALKVFENVKPLIGRDFEDILRTMWPDPLASDLVGIFRHTLATGEPYAQPNTTEERSDTQEVESYSWRIEHINLPDGSVGVVCYFFDITEQKKVEDVLREADRRKSEFLATLAHELRNPLAPMRNGLELLSLPEPDSATSEQARGMMKRQLDQMVRLIDDLMDLSRISRGTVDLRLERVDLRTALKQAVEACKPLFERQEHTLVVHLPDEPVMVDGDLMRLTQVFSNLLNNSAKYTDNGGSIAVRLDVHQDGAVVTVEDNGIGIAPDQLGKVFDMFAQVERTNERVQGGLGIGLNIVKHLVGMHGGSITVRSDGLGKGSSFSVRLPLSAEPVKKTVVDAAARTEKTIAPQRILIVDDNVDAAGMMSLLMGKMGHELRVANNGEEALAVGAELKPDVVLMDLGMPVMDGFAACRLMRKTPWGAKALIVALSGWGQDEDRAKSTEAGFDHHLVKPIGSAALVEVIAAAKRS